MRIKDIIEAFITTGTIIRGTTMLPSERLRSLDPTVRIHLLRVREDSRGVERIWQITCTLPALSQGNSGLRRIGLESTATRLRRILALSLCGGITLVKSWVDRLEGGRSCLVMTVTQYEPASDPSRVR